MSKLKLEAQMMINTLATRGASHWAIARLLAVTEGAIRYQLLRMQASSVDGRSRQLPKAARRGERD